MGFLKDTSTLTKMGKEFRRGCNPVGQMADLSTGSVWSSHDRVESRWVRSCVLD